MPSSRGLVVLGAGLGLWIVARLVGSPDLHIVAVGVTLLPVIASLFVRWGRQRLTLTRRLSATKVWPGQRLSVELEVENRSHASTSFILIEDRLPPALGRAARLVLSGLPPSRSQRVSYSVTCRTRGRYSIGPAELAVSDPFALTRVRVEFHERDDVVVFPEVEDLSTVMPSPQGTAIGHSASRHLFRTGDEFYTMREYQIGDDLRRIHWPSVARRGRLMIRQDESARRSVATVFLDTRVGAFGHAYTPGFERAVSVAASVGSHLARSGFELRLGLGAARPTKTSEERFLEMLAQAGHSPSGPLAPSMLGLRTRAVPESTLVVVTAPPTAAEVSSITRAGAAFGPKLAFIVYPKDPQGLAPEARDRLVRQATGARLSLIHAGWDVVVMSPSQRLEEVWRNSRKPLPAGIVSSR